MNVTRNAGSASVSAWGGSRDYLPSWQDGFAKTDWEFGQHPAGRAQEARLCLFSCGCLCTKGRLLRIHRRPWMRLIPLLRLYRCIVCGAQVLRTKTRQRRGYFGDPWTC